MIHQISKIITVLILLSVFSCKKDKIKIADISGSILNTFSNTPIKGYAVYLATYHNTKSNNTGLKFPSVITTTSNNDGHFIFTNVNINENPDYSYQLIVKYYKDEDFPSQPSVSSVFIDKNNSGNNYIVKTLPWYESFSVKLNPAAPIIYPDSISIEFFHEYYDQNSSSNYIGFKSHLDSRNLRNGNPAPLQSRIMGLWRMNILKIKNGITTNTTDSVFINFDESKTYTLNF